MLVTRWFYRRAAGGLRRVVRCVACAIVWKRGLREPSAASQAVPNTPAANLWARLSPNALVCPVIRATESTASVLTLAYLFKRVLPDNVT